MRSITSMLRRKRVGGAAPYIPPAEDLLLTEGGDDIVAEDGTAITTG